MCTCETSVSSDHWRITFETGQVRGARKETESPPDYSRANWQLYRAEIQRGYKIAQNINSTDEHNATVMAFSEVNSAAAKMAMPQATVRNTVAQPVTADLINKVKYKNKLRKKYQASCDPDIKAKYTGIKEVRKEMLKLKIQKWKNKVSKECGCGEQTFKLCRRLTKTKKTLSWIERPGGDQIHNCLLKNLLEKT